MLQLWELIILTVVPEVAVETFTKLTKMEEENKQKQAYAAYLKMQKDD